MKKNLKLFAILSFIAIMATSCNKTEVIAPANVDSKIATFVATYFPETSILSAMKEGKEYDITLTDGTKIDFDRQEEWEDIDCEYGTIYAQVPAALVPVEIQNYVETNYPNFYIIQISKDSRRWDIELNNHLEIEFDKNFNVVEID